ncbi:MAG: YggT family protein [Clostridia bacterium]|nr:YggT family protein [Clostridia bacterium]
MNALFIIYRVLSILLYAFDVLLLINAICSWVPEWRMSRVYILSSRIIDPILRPIRKFMWRFDWARRCPIDLSFIVLVLITRFLDGFVWRLYLLLSTFIGN